MPSVASRLLPRLVGERFRPVHAHDPPQAQPYIARAVCITDLCPGRMVEMPVFVQYDGLAISEDAHVQVQLDYEVFYDRARGKVSPLTQRFDLRDFQAPYPDALTRAAERLGLEPSRLAEIVLRHADPRKPVMPPVERPDWQPSSR